MAQTDALVAVELTRRLIAFDTINGGLPAAILGPGEPKLAHQTDEYCEMRRIDEAVEIYSRAIVEWCGL